MLKYSLWRARILDKNQVETSNSTIPLVIRDVDDDVAVDDDAIDEGVSEFATKEGFLLCPEGAATYAAFKKGLADGKIAKTDKVLLFNCATGLKYPMPPSNNDVDRHQPVDYGVIAKGID